MFRSYVCRWGASETPAKDCGSGGRRENLGEAKAPILEHISMAEVTSISPIWIIKKNKNQWIDIAQKNIIMKSSSPNLVRKHDWLVVSTPLKNMTSSDVSWDCELPKMWKVIKFMFPNHQPAKVYEFQVDTDITMEKSPCLMGKSTISMAIFQFANCNKLPEGESH